MNNSRLDAIAFIFCVVMLLFIGMLFVTSCLMPDPEQTRVLDADGNVVWAGKGKPPLIMKIPPTGRPTLDYYIGSLAAAIFSAMGYSIRRTNNRMKAIENKPTPERPLLQEPMTTEQLHNLRKLLAPDPTEK